jgi:hypothetical protein
LQPLDEGTVAAHLCERSDLPLRTAARALRDSAPADFAALLKTANGCIGIAEELLDPTRRDHMLGRCELARDICRLLVTRTQHESLLLKLIGIGTQRDTITEHLHTLQQALRDLILLTHAENAPLCFFTNREEALELSW